MAETIENTTSSNFIWDEIAKDLADGKTQKVHTRFPPEPNGYLHIGHCKALCMDFGSAEHFGGVCNLRFDDTNPTKEDTEYAEAIKRDIEWLGFHWDGGLYYGSDYSQKIYEYAVMMIKKGLAYVDELSGDEIKEYRGTLTTPGKNSPWRDRPIEENLELFERMKNGEFPDGTLILRAKIDMASPNINMRDPTMYRIRHMEHYRTGNEWCIYPMYDFAHPLQDSLEGITHSLCDIAYEAHRPLYDWVTRNCEIENPPRQIEFARLNITDTVLSKRYLRALVENGSVMGWDDPRMPTLCGMRRRGFTPDAIKDFIMRAGIAKVESVVDYRLLEHCVREDLKPKAQTRMAVLNPIKVVITDYPEGQTEWLDASNSAVSDFGSRSIPFSRELYIEADDFMEVPAKKFFRMYPGGEVRLKDAYIVKCNEVIKNEDGSIAEIHCTYDPESRSGMPGADRKVKGTLHWVAASTAVPLEVRLFDTLYVTREDGEMELNPDSYEKKLGWGEPSLEEAEEGAVYQFLRVGYFCKDKDSKPGAAVYNRTVSLKSSYKPE